jgi:ribonucleoside-diphosphate reductase alpha chain
MTGILDNKLLRGEVTEGKFDLPQVLEAIREAAIEMNRTIAPIIGVKESASITCVKPEGTVSQLTQTSSGIHPGHSPYYVRRVRQDRKDPLTSFLQSRGVPFEPCVMQPESTVVFEFPQRSAGFTRRDLSAIAHLELWLTYQRHWCDHKPSVTISVKEHEWLTVGAWVYEHFDECTGVSFLPDDGGTYRQAPYEECSEAEYQSRVSNMPTIDWSALVEHSDQVEGAQSLACTAGGCTI